MVSNFQESGISLILHHYALQLVQKTRTTLSTKIRCNKNRDLVIRVSPHCTQLISFNSIF